jgi:hypothetical protein
VNGATRRLGRVAAGVLVLCFFLPAADAGACTGDCDGDGFVSVSELVLGVNIALAVRDVSECPAFDQGEDGSVDVVELTRAVHASRFACPIFPADYHSTFTEVRDCRFSISHDGASIRVFANEIATRPYLDGDDPLPVGSILVKEEYDGSACEEDGEIVRWRAMRKEEPGFDDEDGDWHWQWVASGGTVRFDDKSTCIGCHSAPVCLARDYMCTEGGRGDLQLVLRDLPGAVLSVSGTAATDVYAVGADPDDGLGPLVLHYDGTAWERLATGATGDLWWITVTPVDGSFYMSGSGGLILEYDLTTREFTRYDTPGDATLFGIWGASESDLWAVGDDGDQGGVIWHYDGVIWSVVDLSQVSERRIPPLNKVWGRSSGEVYAVGAMGTALLFDGVQWSEIDSGTQRFLFTVHGNDDVVVATGGFFTEAVVVEKEEGPFTDRTPAGALQLNGVFIPADGSGVAVGRERSIVLRDDGVWTFHDSVPGDVLDYHAVWIDPQGGTWAVGGDLAIDLREGILAYAGTRLLPREVDLGGD